MVEQQALQSWGSELLEGLVSSDVKIFGGRRNWKRAVDFKTVKQSKRL